MIRLHDTMTREKREFVPADPKRITMYVCGPTVYGRAHIGNARPAVVFDLLRRVLEHEYPDAEVIYARAKSLAALNRNDEALAAYRQYLVLRPDGPQAEVARAIIRLQDSPPAETPSASEASPAIPGGAG